MKINRRKNIYIIAGFGLLIVASIIVFFSCTAGVNVGEANKVLTSFSIKWSEGFDYTCKSNEPLDVTINALDQDGNVFSWSGTVNISTTNTSVTVKPSSVDLTNGTATVTLRLSHEAAEALTTYIKVLTGDIITQLPILITIDIAAPKISVKQGSTAIITGGSYDGGSAVIGYYKDIVFTIENLGNVDLELTNTPVAVTISGDSEFNIVSQPSTTTIAPDGSTTFTVRLTPGGVANYSATITILSNDPDTGSYQFSLNGHGIEHDIIVKQGTTPINPGSSYDFGDVNKGELSAWKVFTIENISSRSINISNLELTAGDTTEFTLDTTVMSYTLSSYETTTFRIRFNPISLNTKLSTLTIASDSVEDSFEFTISGNGTYPEIIIKQGTNNIPSGSGSYMFNDTPDGESLPVIFTIENIGTGVLTINNITLTGLDPDQFSLDISEVNTSIYAGGSTIFTVTFSPTSFGEKTAVITVLSNDTIENDFNFIIKGRMYIENKIIAGSADDWFGYSVSISSDGNRIVVGIPSDDWKGLTDAGSINIYTWSGSQWGGYNLKVSDGEAGDYFGHSVAISSDGDKIVVGAYGEGDNGSYSGAVYFCKWDDIYQGWQVTKLTASTGASYDLFGWSVSVSSDGNTIAVGAYGYFGMTGAAYIYKWNSSSNKWDEVKLTASDGLSDDYFGISVSISGNGNTVVVGASGDDNRKGAAYIYNWNNDNKQWEEKKLIASDGASGDRFGKSVSISYDGNTIVVGAYRDGDNGTDSGSAYIYRWDGNSWVETKLISNDGEAGDYFGSSVAISLDGNTIVIGAYGDDDNGSSSGSTYLYNF